jgi:hypothetical protein
MKMGRFVPKTKIKETVSKKEWLIRGKRKETLM